MLTNTTYIIGRLCKEPVIKEFENGNKSCNITLAVTRSNKNENNIYETDFIPVSIWNKMAENTFQYCKKGDLIGIKGHLQCKDNNISIFAEHISFLASKSKIDEIDKDQDIKI